MGLFKRQPRDRDKHEHLTEIAELVCGPCDGTTLHLTRDEDNPCMELSWTWPRGVSCYRRRGTPERAEVRMMFGDWVLYAKFDYAGEVR